MANKSPEHPLTKIHLVRPYRHSDEAAVRAVWSQCSADRHPSFQQYPELSADRSAPPHPGGRKEHYHMFEVLLS